MRSGSLQRFGLRVISLANCRSPSLMSCCWPLTEHRVTSALGHEPLFRSDRTVDRACELDNEGILPDDFRCQLIITKFSALASTVMSENAQNDLVSSREERNSTITRLEYNLDALEVQLEGKNRGPCQLSSHSQCCSVPASCPCLASHVLSLIMVVLNQIWLSCARLQLHVFYFFETSVCDIRKRGLLKAFETASSVVEQMTAADAKSQLMAYAPNYLYRMLILAAICLLKILSSNYSPYVDCASGKRLFNSSLILLRRCSLENNDSVGRASKILGQLWSVHRTLAVGDEEPSLRVRTRLSASVLHDALWFWRQEFGGQENAYRAAEGMRLNQKLTVFVAQPNLLYRKRSNTSGAQCSVSNSRRKDDPRYKRHRRERQCFA